MRNRAYRMMTREGRHFAALRNKLPFVDWLDFKGQAQEFFMTTETRDEAIHQLKNLIQKGMLVEDYIIKFKSLAPLTEFNDYTLVSQFRQGLNPNLGFDIVRAMAPADDDLEAWYACSVEMARAYRDAKKYYGNPTKKRCFTPNNMAGPPMTRKQEETPYPGIKKEETRSVETMEEIRQVKGGEKKNPFICYNCQEEGHMAQNCTKPKKERKDKGKQRAQVVETNWRETLESATEEDKRGIVRLMGFTMDQ